MGLSNPSKTVRRYVASVVDDDEILYKMAMKEYEYDNIREMISKLTNEGHIINLLKREDVGRVFSADFKITDHGLLMDLANNSITPNARYYALNNIEDKLVLLDFIYSSPFSSKKPTDNSPWEGFRYVSYDKNICISIMSRPDFNDTRLIEDF